MMMTTPFCANVLWRPATKPDEDGGSFQRSRFISDQVVKFPLKTNGQSAARSHVACC